MFWFFCGNYYEYNLDQLATVDLTLCVSDSVHRPTALINRLVSNVEILNEEK